MTVVLYGALLWSRPASAAPLDPYLGAPLADPSDDVFVRFVFRMNGERVPTLTPPTASDAPLASWLSALHGAKEALGTEGATCTIPPDLRGTVPLHFERRGGEVILSFASPGERCLRAAYSAFAAEVDQLALRMRQALGDHAPAAADAWWARRVGRLPEGEARLPVLEIDGARFTDQAGFTAEVSEQILAGMPWGGNLDAFNDILRGGFGTPDRGFVFRWSNAALSRDRLGYAETARRYEALTRTCHPSNVEGMRELAEAARRGEGETLFEMLVSLVREHAEDGVVLELA